VYTLIYPVSGPYDVHPIMVCGLNGRVHSA